VLGIEGDGQAHTTNNGNNFFGFSNNGDTRSLAPCVAAPVSPSIASSSMAQAVFAFGRNWSEDRQL
jgi:hypothetical protein